MGGPALGQALTDEPAAAQLFVQPVHGGGVILGLQIGIRQIKALRSYC